MNDREIRYYEMFTRVRDFGAANAGSFPANSLGGAKFVALSVVISDLDEHGAVESSGRSALKVGTASKREARESLRRQMESISRTAKGMAGNTPGLENSFRLPRANGDQALINAARAFVTDATPLKKEFVKWELSDSFLEDLGAAIESFEQSVNSKNLSQSRSVAATAAIDEAIERGKKTVRDLDPIIRNKFRDDPATLAAWLSASHVERSPQKRKKIPPGEQTPGSMGPEDKN